MMICIAQARCALPAMAGTNGGSQMHLNNEHAMQANVLHDMQYRCGAGNLRRGSYRVNVAVFTHSGGFGRIWK